MSDRTSPLGDDPGVGNVGAVALVNLTPHPVTLYSGDVPGPSWPPTGRFARVIESRGPVDTVLTDRGQVPVVGMSYAPQIADLPEPVLGTAFLVSRVLAAAVARTDLLFPADEVRDETGRIVGCRFLGRFVSRAQGVASSTVQGGAGA